VVTELWNPNGLPTTIAASPTRRSADRPTLTTVSPVRRTFSTARSLLRSRPTNRALSGSEVDSVTPMVRAPSTTCALVST
jgi:hypothetical protein